MARVVSILLAFTSTVTSRAPMNWMDHDSHAKAFERLLRDLRTGARVGATA